MRGPSGPQARTVRTADGPASAQNGAHHKDIISIGANVTILIGANVTILIGATVLTGKKTCDS
jgi:hypothetical protein